MIVKIWACPTDGCGNYYASSAVVGQNLDTEMSGGAGMNGEKYPERAHTRAQCPDCRDRGLEVERIPIAVDLTSRISDTTAATANSRAASLVA